MSKTIRLTLAAMGVVIGCSTAMLQASDNTQGQCPAGYSLMGSLCMDSATGDIVYATPPPPHG
jgi:hypothetical protein